jgi:hypothetical protein
MTITPSPAGPPSTQRYRSVVEGVELANEFTQSRLTMAEFARQRGVTMRMVAYWTKRARLLAAATSAELVQVAEISGTGSFEALPAEGVPIASAVIAAPSPTALGSMPTIEVRLPNGVRIGIAAGFSPAVLAQVVTCLGGKSC